ncbi:MAG: hypothetical protein AB7U20_21500, partial [Planctomycetaceae bacterium]
LRLLGADRLQLGNPAQQFVTIIHDRNHLTDLAFRAKISLTVTLDEGECAIRRRSPTCFIHPPEIGIMAAPWLCGRRGGGVRPFSP